MREKIVRKGGSQVTGWICGRVGRPLLLAKAASIPKFVGEIPAFLHLFLVVPNVGSLGGDTEKSEAESIRSVFGDEIKGIRGVSEGLRELSSFAVTDESGEVDVSEGKFPHVFEPRHDHPSDPEKDDIRTSDQIGGWVKLFQFCRLFGPTHGRKGPEPRAEPGIKNIRVLDPSFPRGFDLTADLLLSVPNRNSVPPPQLAADAPVLQIFHPVVVDFSPSFRKKAEG